MVQGYIRYSYNGFIPIERWGEGGGCRERGRGVREREREKKRRGLRISSGKLGHGQQEGYVGE